MHPGEIGGYGERHVEAWLQANGFNCYRNTQQPGAIDIQARSGAKTLLVQVKTGLQPNPAPSATPEERRRLTTRATNLGYEAWVARLQINAQALQVGKIQWEKLN